MSGKKTFHQDGATEVRMTILKDKKRVDVHIFEADSVITGPLADIVSKSKDGDKVECSIEGGKLTEIKKDSAT